MSLLGHDFTVDTEESVSLETQIFSITKALLMLRIQIMTRSPPRSLLKAPLRHFKDLRECLEGGKQVQCIIFLPAQLYTDTSRKHLYPKY